MTATLAQATEVLGARYKSAGIAAAEPTGMSTIRSVFVGMDLDFEEFNEWALVRASEAAAAAVVASLQTGEPAMMLTAQKTLVMEGVAVGLILAELRAHEDREAERRMMLSSGPRLRWWQRARLWVCGMVGR